MPSAWLSTCLYPATSWLIRREGPGLHLAKAPVMSAQRQH